ncbi:hypothetical protein [Staphylococcus succinus]|uniref:hypothetical protein n=1 Tax=Staphylococcus succinus TaxID=61015 RepID=UPI000A6B1258|nr:hypothetical protein [Staphylococcus succinus]MBU0439319.1 hypothetical protein [Staphylococcus succinus]
MERFLEKVFVIFLFLSILTALIMVLLQILGLVIGNGEFIIKVNETLLTPAIILAAIFSGIAFVLGYFPKYKDKN